MEIKHFNNDNFKEEVLDCAKPVLVDFFATWCGPCKMLTPTLEEIASENDDFIVGKVDIDEAFDLARTYGVMSVPTMIVFKDGLETERMVGLRNKSAILGVLKK